MSECLCSVREFKCTDCKTEYNRTVLQSACPKHKNNDIPLVKCPGHTTTYGIKFASTYYGPYSDLETCIDDLLRIIDLQDLYFDDGPDDEDNETIEEWDERHKHLHHKCLGCVFEDDVIDHCYITKNQMIEHFRENWHYNPTGKEFRLIRLIKLTPSI